jgi:hypothetical protein
MRANLKNSLRGNSAVSEFEQVLPQGQRTQRRRREEQDWFGEFDEERKR